MGTSRLKGDKIMKLEVGMYVRFNYHRVTVPIQISKIKEKHYEDIERYYYYLTDNGLVISEAQILKASNNIIDILEEGDYVNGHRVDKVVIGPKCSYVLLEEVGCYVDSQEDIADYEIKSIVTKEMFSQMQYKVD